LQNVAKSFSVNSVVPEPTLTPSSSRSLPDACGDASPERRAGQIEQIQNFDLGEHSHFVRSLTTFTTDHATLPTTPVSGPPLSSCASQANERHAESIYHNGFEIKPDQEDAGHSCRTEVIGSIRDAFRAGR